MSAEQPQALDAFIDALEQLPTRQRTTPKILDILSRNGLTVHRAIHPRSPGPQRQPVRQPEVECAHCGRDGYLLAAPDGGVRVQHPSHSCAVAARPLRGVL